MHRLLRVYLACGLLFIGCHAAVAALKNNIPEMAQCRQLIVVVTPDWTSSRAVLRCCERADGSDAWKDAGIRCDAGAGRNGLAWGIGVHGTHPATGPVKHEGDGRAPAGIYRLREIFGIKTPAQADISRFPYRQVTASSFGVDDPASRYYNRIVDLARVEKKDWKSAEPMVLKSGVYRWGIVVEHNWDKPLPGGGSCIFLHIWPWPGYGTSGCTAMEAGNLETIIRWLDASKQPLLVQLPAAEYARLKVLWHLP